MNGVVDILALQGIAQHALRFDDEAALGRLAGEIGCSELAPYVDAVLIGIKGSGNREFYDQWMRSKGAMRAVKRACRVWREMGVHVAIGDLIAPPQMQSDKVCTASQRRIYTWIAEALGPLTPMMPMAMVVPGPGNQIPRDEWGGLLLRANATCEDYEHYKERMGAAHEVARECGLQYVYGRTLGPDEREIIRCHNCDGVLIDKPTPMLDCKPCTMNSHFCIFWKHDQHVTDGCCDHCGAEVPIVTLSTEDLAASRRYVAEISKTARSLRRSAKSEHRSAPITAAQILRRDRLREAIGWDGKIPA